MKRRWPGVSDASHQDYSMSKSSISKDSQIWLPTGCVYQISAWPCHLFGKISKLWDLVMALKLGTCIGNTCQISERHENDDSKKDIEVKASVGFLKSDPKLYCVNLGPTNAELWRTVWSATDCMGSYRLHNNNGTQRVYQYVLAARS